MKQFITVLLCLALVYFRTDFFSVSVISAPLLDGYTDLPCQEAIEALSQNYSYLGKGRQSYAFESSDGKWVVKFFNRSYFCIPFWAKFFSKERSKREKREAFYQNSYRIAASCFKEETGIIYLHQGTSYDPLPELKATDRAGRSHTIDLKETPFVLQRKAEPFYPTLKTLPQEDFDRAITRFLSIVASRIAQKIGDGDCNVEDNFGILGGEVVQIDPGKFHLKEDLWDEKNLKYEWWSATHRFKRWLEENAPDRISLFENTVKMHMEALAKGDHVPKNS